MNTDFNLGEILKVLGIMMIAFVPLGGIAIYALRNGDKLFTVAKKKTLLLK
jgi:hypothetical protein